MKSFVLAALATLAIVSTGAISAHADTFTVHGIWDTYKSGK
ncbi:MAG: hypothetical protein AB1749_10335 [Pseudomonadota bacterium]